MKTNESFTLTARQYEHCVEIGNAWKAAMEEKFLQGAKQHGGDLLDKTPLWLLNEAILENIDQFVYLYTLKQKLMKELGNGD